MNEGNQKKKKKKKKIAKILHLLGRRGSARTFEQPKQNVRVSQKQKKQRARKREN